MTYYSTMNSPVGELLLLGDGDALTGLYMEQARHGPGDAPRRRDDAAFVRVREELEAYFAGERFRFEVPLAPEGTPFQRRVWRALEDIPYAATESYGELAARIGQPSASRAVGAANGKNPISIIVPCHRVIGKSGALVGYGGGMARKRWLLAHEEAAAGLTLFSAAPPPLDPPAP